LGGWLFVGGGGGGGVMMDLCSLIFQNQKQHRGLFMNHSRAKHRPEKRDARFCIIRMMNNEHFVVHVMPVVVRADL